MNKKSQSKAMSVFKLLIRNLRKLIFLGGWLPCAVEVKAGLMALFEKDRLDASTTLSAPSSSLLG